MPRKRVNNRGRKKRVDKLRDAGITPLKELLPRKVRILGGVGPTPISRRVSQAMTLGLGIDHLGSPMSDVTDQIMKMTRLIFEVPEEYVALCSYGAATGAMEMALKAVVRKNTSVLSCINGHFSRRMAKIAGELRARVTKIEAPLGKAVTLEMVKKELQGNHGHAVLTIGHGETSTGVISNETGEICCLAKQSGLITVVDGVCTIPSIPLPLPECGIDICFGGAQKGFASIPGANPLVLSPLAWEEVLTRAPSSSSRMLDPRAAYEFWVKKKYHVTAPVQVLFALHTAMLEILTEGLIPFRKRHRVASQALQKGLEAAGFELYTPAKDRLPTAIAIRFGTPDGRGESERSGFRNALKDLDGVVIAGAFGGLPIVRVGCMGWQATETHIRKLLWALASRVKDYGLDTHRYHGSIAVRKVFEKAGYPDPFRSGRRPEENALAL